MTMEPITRRNALKTAVAGAAVLAFGIPIAEAADAVVKLRVMATSDLHVNVFPYDYYRDKPDDTVGLAKTAALIAAARGEAKNALLVDNGDFIQGTPLGDYVAYEKPRKDGDVHPMVAAMDTLGYACGTLGNHEFNYGLDFLASALAGANFPIVCANVLKADGTPLADPTTVVETTVVDEAGAEHVLKVGIIGFVPPQIMQWDQSNLEGKVTTLDIVEAAEKHVPDLAKRSDLVIALCHSGIAAGPRKGGEENAALFLAAVPGIDVIVTGHQHLLLPGKDFAGIEGVDAEKGTLAGKPAVQPGFWGSHLGVIDLTLEKSADGWAVARHAVEARPIYERTEDRKVIAKVEAVAAVESVAKADHEGTLAYVRAPVGETTAPITSYWALIADDPSVQIVSQAQLWYGAEQAKAAGLPDLPLLSAAAPFKSGGRGGPDYYTDVKPGPVAIKDVADIYLYPNTIRIVKVTGADVREWLERSAGIFNRIDPAKTEPQDLIDPKFPAYNFDVMDGVTYRIDVTQPRRYDGDGKLENADAHRIVDLARDGRPVDPADEFLVVTNNYRAGGGGNFPGADGSTIVFQGPDTNRDVIVRYIHQTKTLNPSADANWRFVPWPETATVRFVSSPNANPASLPKGVTVEKAGAAEGGFETFRVRLG